MDPCPFVRVLVGNLALKIPVASRSARSAVHPSTSPYFCRVRLGKLPPQTSPVPLSPPPDASFAVAASFDLRPSDLDRLRGAPTTLKVEIYTGRRGNTCGLSSGWLLGRITVSVNLDAAAEGRACVFHNGWVPVGKGGGNKGEIHMTVRSEPDPRFVFEFGGEPECSPQVFQVQGTMRQPVFTCKFCCRNSGDRNNRRTMSMQSEPSSSRSWLSSFGSDRERPGKERKGWSVTVHDLSGSPVALASMVTPFVPSPGSDRVSRSNPGAWLILRPGDGTWKPWGRLEAWRERGGSTDGLGYRFELLPDTNMSSTGVLLAESTLSVRKGGKFTVDLTVGGGGGGTSSSGSKSASRSGTPGCSPRGSGDYGHALWPFNNYRGFVMSSTVGAEGKFSKPGVEIGFQNVGCAEDAAAFVALAAAVDLSMDACRLFSRKLRKELLGQQQDEFV